MKIFDELSMNDQKEIVKLFTNWLQPYTQEVINKVIRFKKAEIINNEFAMNLLRELKEREEKESVDFAHNIGNLMHEFDVFEQYDPHNHPLTHAHSYRDILYDMFIR